MILTRRWAAPTWPRSCCGPSTSRPTSSPPASRSSSSSDWAVEVDLAEVTRLAKTIDRWRVELLAYFRTNRASSGPVEAVNGEIEQVDRIARGFCNFDNYRTRMLLKTTVAWHTPATPRLRGRGAQSDPAAPSFIAQGRFDGPPPASGHAQGPGSESTTIGYYPGPRAR